MTQGNTFKRTKAERRKISTIRKPLVSFITGKEYSVFIIKFK